MIARTTGINRVSERGNVFLAIFGAIALVGLLGASVMTFMKGPLSTSVKLTKINTAENQMMMGAQVAVMATAAQANNGDCETTDPDGAGPLPAAPTPDGTVEPMPWRSATTEPIPTGGGLVPLSLGISKKDPWGTEYGYCVWNHGSVTSNAGCGSNMLAGASGVGYTAYPVVALISAGPDKTFSTTCRTFAASDVNSDGDLLDATDLPMVSKAAETDDDIITSYTYQEATGVSGGLWSLKAGDPTKATIGKNIETTGRAEFKGGLLLPDKALVDCTDITNAGVMAKNGTTGIEICDGAGTWTAITGGGVTGNNLVLTPNVSSAMNVSGTCGNATCYSTNVTFTVTNKAASASPVLTAALTNTTNFEFVSNNCSGQTLTADGTPGSTCQMVVRAKASGNVSYAGTLQITGGNSPLATLDGIASGFAGCNAGGNAPGGYYVACGVSGSYNLIVTPSGCSGGTTNPTCSGGADTILLAGASPGFTAVQAAMVNGTFTSTGVQNTVNLMAYSGGLFDFPAANYCSGLVYGGYDDWFLPSGTELLYLYNNKTLVGSASTGTYQSSSESNFSSANNWAGMNIGPGTIGTTVNGLIRCMRRDPVNLANPFVDTTPAPFTFTPSYGAAGVTRTSNTITIYAVTQPISVSVSGGTNPRISKNGGAYTAGPITATNGDQITLQATSPASGQESVISVTAGTVNSSWLVRTQGNNILRVFTTAGGVTGAEVNDAKCTTVASAAGLPGSWMVLAIGPGGDLATKMPWNWNVMRNMNGQTVATSVADFLDGTIAAPLSYSQTGAPVSGPVWTGMTATGTAASFHCSNWMSGNGASSGDYGESSSTSAGNYMRVNGTGCNNTYRLYCMEVNSVGSDLDPNDVSIAPQVVFTSGSTGTSNTITVTGVTDSVSVAITPSAGTANIIKSGVPLGATSTTAGLNETLVFTLTAPTVLGTKNTATITIGPDTYTWWVGYADQAREARAFVTSTSSNGAMGGVTGADAICNTRAAASALGLPGNWKAFLSTTTQDAMDRISWNWGTLKTVTGVNIVDGGFPDMFDGTLDGSININELGATEAVTVRTATYSSGLKSPKSFSASVQSNYCNEYTTSGSNTADGTTAGLSSNTTSTWTDLSAVNHSCSTYFRLYCIEDVDNAAPDTTPNEIVIPYAIQVPTSSRQTSTAVLIGGMSSGATQTMTVSATGGTPTFKINGGAEVTSGTVRNGDSIVFLMSAPATANSNHKMTITVGGLTTYWRVWTGDASASLVKRVFVTSTNYLGSDIGGLVGADAKCQTRAGAASLGGTWKAILSGTDESDWAINRVGYNWWKLQLIDGTDVVVAPNLWTPSPSLLSPIIKSELGTNIIGSEVFTNTTPMGIAKYTIPHGGNCNVYTLNVYGGSANAFVGYTSSSNSSWIAHQDSWAGCSNGRVLYCIEQ